MDVICLNLERAKDRFNAFRGAASQRGIPADKLYFKVAKDARDFDDDFSALIKGAADDGFPFVECYGQGISDDVIQQTPATMSQAWNYCRMFRHIIETGRDTMILHDDRMITVDYDVCEAVLDTLKGNCQEFYMWQLRIRRVGGSPVFPPEVEIKHEEDVFGLFGRQTWRYSDIAHLYLAAGLCGGDESMVISPAGAAWILKSLEENPGDYMFFDIFINSKLTELANHEKSYGKGIYTSRKKGYAFAEDYLDMGTSTNYAKEGTKEYQKSISSTPVQFIGKDDPPKIEEPAQVEQPAPTVVSADDPRSQLERILNG